MATVMEMLAARKAAMAEAQEAGAVPGHTTGTIKGSAADILAGKIAVGMQGSSESVIQAGDVVEQPHVLDEDRVKDAVAVFRNIRLRKHIAKNGVLLRPEMGYFYVTDEADVPDFHHYEKLGLITEVKLEKK